MLKSTGRMAVSLLLIGLGFCLAVYSQWTSSINYQVTHQECIVHVQPDGTILSIPKITTTESLIVTSAPYYEAPMVDLFGSTE